MTAKNVLPWYPVCGPMRPAQATGLGEEVSPVRPAAPITQEELPLAAVQRALRKTTEVLARELAGPSAEAPNWSETEWRVARAVVAMHGVSGLLAQSLPWQGPPEWGRFLGEQYAQIARRHMRIQELLQLLDSRARDRGIALLALKGAALHARALYAPGERPMADIDLLVREHDILRASQLLTELGFCAGAETRKHRTFDPPGNVKVTTALGESSAAAIKIELHSRIREFLPLRPVDISSLVFPSAPHPGINEYASDTGLFLHLLLHAAGAMVLREVRLLQLNDIAHLARRMGPLEWEALFEQAASTADEHPWWALPPLVLTDRYYGCVPAAILARLAAGCQWSLRTAYRRRRLSDVSHSYLWISAFPGIEWSRSLREMATYAAERVRPRPETFALRATFAESQPLVSGGQWSSFSQRRRMMRWLLARQPRQSSLQPVRAALNDPPS